MRRDYDFSRGRRGAVVPAASGKTRITIRLDNEILDWFRAQAHAAGGGNYQRLINDALREFISRRREPLEETLRQVIREEMCVYPPRLMGRGPRRAGKAAGELPKASHSVKKP